MRILDRLEKGELSPEEAAEALERDPEAILDALESPMEVLEAVESGSITPDEAAQKLGEGEPGPGPGPIPDWERSPAAEVHATGKALGHLSAGTSAGSKHANGSQPKMMVIADEGRVNLGFVWPSVLGMGVVAILLSAVWMANRISTGAGLDLWFFVAWLPMLIGLLLVAVGWASMARPWLQVHVRHKSGSERVHFQFGFPLPMSIIRWLVRKAGERSGRFNYLDVDAMLYKLEHGIADEPIRVHVDGDDEDVEIQIGYTE